MQAERPAYPRAQIQRFARVEASELASPMYGELAAASAARPVWQVALEGSNPQLFVTRYRGGTGETESLADVLGHGWRIEWRLARA